MTLYACGMNDEERRARNREANRRWRERNPDEARRRSREAMQRFRDNSPEAASIIAARSYDKNGEKNRQRWRDKLASLKSGPCLDCGNSYPPYVMQFDHRDPDQKLFHIDSVSMSRQADKLAAEIAKCDLICANCHAERTHQQRLSGLKFGGAPRTRARSSND